MADKWDVVVLGAGAAGMTAAAELARADAQVLVLEARIRVGGRMFTQRDPATGTAVELGAEFIHGRPPEIFDRLERNGILANEASGSMWRFEGGHLRPANTFAEVDRVMEQMDDTGPDESFLRFVERCCNNPDSADAKDWARRYVTGFHAADPALISVHSLVKEMRAEEAIGGDHSYRMHGGYATLVNILLREMKEAGASLRLQTVIKSIRWKRGEVTLITTAGETISSARAVITLPLGVLQKKTGTAGSVSFTPEITDKKDALAHLAMGKVIRVTLCFRERFWDSLRSNSSLSDMSFLFSTEDPLPTWWTLMPDTAPIITGWAPFHCAQQLAGIKKNAVTSEALQKLSKLFGIKCERLHQLLAAAYTHNWQEDPFSAGAYSYVMVGGDNAQQALATPLEDTLFFAGEATDSNGRHGTVHGAVASGHRAAMEMLNGFRPRINAPHK